MPNPAQKQLNNEELAEVSALFEDYGHPYHRNVVQSTQSGGNDPGLDTSLIAKRLALATAAADSVFNNPDAEPEFEPDDEDSARAAVERLERLFASVPGTFTALLEGARSGAEVLSGNRLQGLSEIVQNADDAGATEVHFLLQPDALLIAHNGRPVCLRDVHALATPWVTTKRHNSKALGRFGIGLMTLQALSDTLDLHSGPYDVRFGDLIVTAIEPFSIPTGFANADSRAATLYVTKSSLMRSVDAGGQAIAGLFTTNRRSVAQAWLAACDSAKSGREALLLELASDRQKVEEAQRAADIAVRMAAFQNETQLAHNQRRSFHADASPRIVASPSHTAVSTPNPLRPQSSSSRNLVDSSRYRLVDPRGRATGVPHNEGSRRVNTGSREANGGATPKALSAPDLTGMPPNEYSRPRTYTEVAKESVGLDFVRQVFASDEQEIRDLRAQHGVGADAVDALDRFFELKVYAGMEHDRIALEDSQIRRAMSTPNFFLVVVSELEGENASPKVRIIIDPLSQLYMSESSSVTFTGVRSSQSIVYQFEQED